MFAVHTDLVAFYLPLVELHDVSSTTCPAMELQISKLNEVTLSLSPDQTSLLDEVPAPHGAETRIRLLAKTSAGGDVTVEGSRPLYRLMEPIWTAVEDCSKPSFKK